MRLRRFATALLILSGILLQLHGGEFLERVVKNMGKIKSIQTDFKQEKRLRNFAFPLKISGIMCADHTGNRFAWRVHKPMINNCIITKDFLIQYDGDSNKVVKLASSGNPALKMLSDTLRILFSGDIKGMLKDFTVKEEKNPLTLYPGKNSSFAVFIKSIRLTFSKDLKKIRRIELEEKSGDITVIDFFNTSINTPIKDSLWQVKP